MRAIVHHGATSRAAVRPPTRHRAEFQRIAIATAVGFAVMGFMGYIIKVRGAQASAPASALLIGRAVGSSCTFR